MADRRIYLDYAAATPLDSAVAEAMRPYLSDNFYNPSAAYLAARTARSTLEAARSQVAHWVGAKPSEVIFTAGGTEANNLAIHGVMRRYPGAKVVVSALEHESVLAPAHRYAAMEAAVQADGRVDRAALHAAIDDNTVLVSIMYANNEIGTVQPLREVSKMVQQIREERRKAANKLPLYLHTDACQAANYLDLHVARLAVDLMTINGGKIYGPKQSGVLYVKAGIELLPLIDGGGQERGLRSGTENIAGAVGLAAALEEAQLQRPKEAARLQELQQQFIKGITEVAPGAVINGSQKFRLPNNVHLTFPGQDNERLLIQLDESGIMAAAGSACSASNEEPSHVLRAIGVDEADAQASLRFTMGRNTTTDEVTEVIKTLKELL